MEKNVSITTYPKSLFNSLSNHDGDELFPMSIQLLSSIIGFNQSVDIKSSLLVKYINKLINGHGENTQSTIKYKISIIPSMQIE